MRSILITGCNRGIGLEFVKQLLNLNKPKPEIIIATCRNISAAKELNDLASNDKRLHILEIDLANFSAYNEFAKKLSAVVGDKGLNVLFNNAGLLLSRNAKLGDPELTPEFFSSHFATNTIAPIILTQSLLPLLRKAANTNANLPFSISKAVVVNMSSSLGSIAMNDSSTFWGYRESKAALDMASRSMVSEFHEYGIAVLILHPGWVQTDMGTKNATLTPTESVTGLLKVMLALSPKTNGAFLDYSGKEMPW